MHTEKALNSGLEDQEGHSGEMRWSKTEELLRKTPGARHRGHTK